MSFSQNMCILQHFAGEEVLYSHLITRNCHKLIIYNDIILCLIMHKIMNYDQ